MGPGFRSLCWTALEPLLPHRSSSLLLPARSQGNDVGTQYRSAIFTHTPEQLEAANKSKAAFQAKFK